MLLPQSTIQQLWQATVALSLGREALISSLPAAVSGQLKVAGSPAEQHLLDLNRLNRMTPLADGSIPLKAWLEVAKMLSTGRAEQAVFADALAALAAGPVEPASAPAPTVSPTAALIELLSGMFRRPRQLSRFVYMRLGDRALMQQLPGTDLPFAEWVVEFVMVLDENQRIDDAFFAALLQERPGSAATIRDVQQLW